ncbi:hypothetical protein FOC1_g10003034 [Fusarium oxysporum f. sp. cubense race 1]|uniref:Peptidase S1 domain-containing protein n=1 Tax=Fusarium oxysporum f. sp. cubense (strain race 1) TaxID=1229664 RepID=N4UJD1_FUSC1|nr:hypothetical protein FOC1_g10003034 [Fusarium oxysporum f. sp. cubense race 1]
MRGKPGSTTARPTVIMLADWSTEKSDSFTRAAQRMAAYLDVFSRIIMSPIYVEIVSRDLIKTKYYGPVNEPALSRTWDTVSDLIYERLQSLPTTRGYLTCLALQKFGVNHLINTNPATVYISMDHRSDETSWYGVVSAVKDVLDRIAGWEHVQIHIEHNLNMPCAFETLPSDPSKRASGEAANKRITGNYSETAHIGDDFSPSRYVPGDIKKQNPGFGTVGCFVQIKTKSDAEWRTCVLTNHHVVRAAFDGFALHTQPDGETVLAPPPEGSDLWKMGCTTGATTGEHHWEKQRVTMDHDQHLGNARLVTTELVFGPRYDVDLSIKLCAHGDSGSVLFDKDGGIVALLFRGHKHNDSYDDGYGYVTPIEHVFNDIKDFTDITNIRIAV